MRILAIDPGNQESAWLEYDTETGLPMLWAKEDNQGVARRLRGSPGVEALAIEMIASYGMAVGAEVFDTCVWIGRFIECWGARQRTSLFRREVKLHLCESVKAKDANVRQALIDRYGGKEKAIGKKATPGPLYGLTADCWSALAVAITYAEREL